MAILNWMGNAIGLDKDMLFAENAHESKGGGIISVNWNYIILQHFILELGVRIDLCFNYGFKTQKIE